MLIKRQISVANHGYQADVPDECPLCHRHSEVQFVQGDRTESGQNVQTVWRCAFVGCRSYFICYYGSLGSGHLLAVKPVKPSIAGFSDAVKKISPTFAEVFTEAEEAAQLGLRQVAGPGYRKAFEFLVKDYAKLQAPDKAKEIEEKFSGAVVNEFIADARIQDVAKRCLWLGNDETHYLRKWTDHDLSDLVTLVKLAAHWIEIEHLSESYMKSMPEVRRS
jgi:hypothetical protein